MVFATVSEKPKQLLFVLELCAYNDAILLQCDAILLQCDAIWHATLIGQATRQCIHGSQKCIYRMGENFGGEFILADWRF